MSTITTTLQTNLQPAEAVETLTDPMMVSEVAHRLTGGELCALTQLLTGYGATGEQLLPVWEAWHAGDADTTRTVTDDGTIIFADADDADERARFTHDY